MIDIGLQVLTWLFHGAVWVIGFWLIWFILDRLGQWAGKPQRVAPFNPNRVRRSTHNYYRVRR